VTRVIPAPFWLRTLEPCLGTPGCWHLIHTSTTPTLAVKLVRGLTRRKVQIPAGEWAFASVDRDIFACHQPETRAVSNGNGRFVVGDCGVHQVPGRDNPLGMGRPGYAVFDRLLLWRVVSSFERTERQRARAELVAQAFNDVYGDERE
jgi:hypothetical protein